MKTLTKNDIAEKLSKLMGMPKSEAMNFVQIFFDSVVDVLVNKESLKFSGFGNFIINHKKSRPGRNPKTGEDKEISARWVVTFKPGSKFKDRLLAKSHHDFEELEEA
jgi:integration host factor subunit alpha